ncbi:hypothetical protein GIB67_038299 [Kingdonia uniflora]|uniref:Nuclear factor related to kappa-B-binding protein n=1 Tax=Kingdonia uniflora TaxID=39325 RepID=A0A7J7KUJ2_9MAGN|nr:hypothetical protein GIB67_038299 [Kingdonia uniflora]
MAAGQHKKRPNASSIMSCNLEEQFSVKKKRNVDSSKDFLKTRTLTSLEWDHNLKRVAAKKEQIAITWRNLGPFVTSSSHQGKELADVLSIPKNLFELEDISGVLSHEVWQENLSETDRYLLTQFLPKEVDATEAVQEGASLCSGNLHPDDVVCREKSFKTNMKVYYSELQSYHNGMLEKLRRMKELWETCKDPEKDVIEQIWSSRKHVDNSHSSHAKEFRPWDPEENLTATGESCSRIADESVFNSNKQKNVEKESGELRMRGGFVNRCVNSSLASERSKLADVSRKEKKSHKFCTRSGDGAKYMSYFKVTKKQHQQLKGMHQSVDGIKSKSLSRVLGDLKKIQVQSYGSFQEEEQIKLHDYWLQLAKRDLPLAFAKWTERQLLKQQWRKSLEQEMTEKKIHGVYEDEEKGNADVLLHEQRNDGETYPEVAMDVRNSEGNEEESSYSLSGQPFEQIPSLNDHIEFKPETKLLGNMKSAEHIAKRESPFQQILSLNGHHELNSVNMELRDERQNILQHESGIPTLTEFAGNMNSSESSYYNPLAEPDGYISTRELSLGQPYLHRDQSPYLINLGNPEDTLVHMPSNDLGTTFQVSNGGSFFGSYQGHNEFLQPEHKPLQYQFTATNDRLLESGHHHGHFREQQQMREMKERESYMHYPVINRNMYSPHPSKEHLPSMGVQNWALDPVRVSAPLQVSSNDTELWAQNCYPNEHQVPGQFLNNGGHTNDGIYGALSQFSRLQSCSSYNSLSGVDQDIQERTYVGGVVPSNINVFQRAGHQLNYLSGHEGNAGTALKANDIPWMSLPHQNSGLHDSVGKPFIRSWNQ